MFCSWLKTFPSQDDIKKKSVFPNTRRKAQFLTLILGIWAVRAMVFVFGSYVRCCIGLGFPSGFRGPPKAASGSAQLTYGKADDPVTPLRQFVSPLSRRFVSLLSLPAGPKAAGASWRRSACFFCIVGKRMRGAAQSGKKSLGAVDSPIHLSLRFWR